jgi:alanine transaminase
MALCAFPNLMNNEEFPSDVKLKAQRLLDCCGGGSVGAYSDSTGKRQFIVRIVYPTFLIIKI